VWYLLAPLGVALTMAFQDTCTSMILFPNSCGKSSPSSGAINTSWDFEVKSYAAGDMLIV